MTGSVIAQDNSAKESNGTAFQLSSTDCQPTATSELVSCRAVTSELCAQAAEMPSIEPAESAS